MKLEFLKYRAAFLTFICTLLVLLWVYTAGSKLSDFAEFKRQLANQTFGKNAASLLLWFIPLSEIVAALLLLFSKTRVFGLILSAILMCLFTGYIGLVLTGYYDRMPCSCGGVLKDMGWHLHFWFNLYFLFISCFGIWLYGLTEKNWSLTGKS